MTYRRRPLRFALAAAALLAVLSGAVPLPAQGPDSRCGLCNARGRVSCPECRGDGVERSACRKCGDDGRIACANCAASARRAVFSADAGRISRGRVDCVNPRCEAGRVRGADGKPTVCRICGGTGSLDCGACPDGVLPCPCGGKRPPRACEACAGATTVPCPGCAVRPAADSCVLCGGKSRRACERCRTAVKRRSPCWTCDGKGVHACPACRATGKTLCLVCAGGGRGGRWNRDGKFESVTCAVCSGAGSKPCPRCQGGRADCNRCEKGFLPETCGTCDGGQVACPGCARGPGGGAAVLAGFLVDAGRYESAVPWYEAALDAARRRSDALGKELETLGLPDLEKLGEGTDRKSLEALLKRVRRGGEIREEMQRLGAGINRLENELAELRTWLPPSEAAR